MHTVYRERFAGRYQHQVFTEILLRCLGHNCSLFSTFEGRCLYSQKNFWGIPENHEKRESLAKRIFSRLWYMKTLKQSHIGIETCSKLEGLRGDCLHEEKTTILLE